ncbi:MAG: hypothetical protein CMM53_04600 [Rhodospirillaceae bacterium]|nr:hypothetical protein [Rhodospirillaceae bacterium]|tara:strand:+ start:707 stop:1600 length:894 start_codon:yes stop_codon:yes gene_type:complete
MKKTQIKIFLIFIFCALIVNTQAIKAQQYIGYHVQPNVIVNNDVIESIAPLPNIARSLLQIQRKKPVAASTKLKQLNEYEKYLIEKKQHNHQLMILEKPALKNKFKTYKFKNKIRPKQQLKKHPEKVRQLGKSRISTFNETFNDKKIKEPIDLTKTNQTPRLASQKTRHQKTKRKNRSQILSAAIDVEEKKLRPNSKFTLKFVAESSSLGDNAKTQLALVLDTLKRDQSYHLQLFSYAQATDKSVLQARRISLRRAIETRAYFIDNGIDRVRIGVKALGNKSDNQFPNRIDIIVKKR